LGRQSNQEDTRTQRKSLLPLESDKGENGSYQTRKKHMKHLPDQIADDIYKLKTFAVVAMDFFPNLEKIEDLKKAADRVEAWLATYKEE